MTDKPKPIAYTTHEGGGWLTWNDNLDCKERPHVHAIKFNDGSIFDSVNGWRPDVTNRARDEIIATLATVVADLKEFWK